MPAIGITGGISSGKTTFCECLREFCPAAKFFNADKAARDLVDLDPQVKEELLREFGPGIFSDTGLNRERLRHIIFQDAAKKSALERILHSRIRRQWSAEAKKHRNAPEFFFADIPLLYETGGEALCDRVVAVACSCEIQVARLLTRGRIDRAIAGQMIDSQMPSTEKIKRADHVVWNNAERSVLSGQAGILVRFWRS